MKFPKEEHLKSKKLIGELFKTGKSITCYPIKIVWDTTVISESNLNQAGFTVPKRIFKKAVDRNLIKRRMREAYRLNKVNLLSTTCKAPEQLNLMFIFIGKTMVPFTTIEKQLKKGLERLSNIQ